MSGSQYALFLTAPGTLELGDLELPPLERGQARVRVAGCGVCHTDLGFYSGTVRTRHDLPLVLGHEIAGVVEDIAGVGDSLIGRQVLVPAVMPCGTCDLCTAGRPLVDTYVTEVSQDTWILFPWDMEQQAVDPIVKRRER